MKNFNGLKGVLVAGILLSLSFQGLAQMDLKKAISLTQSELFDDANIAYKNLIKTQPKNGDYYYYLGENFLNSYFSDTVAVSLREMEDSAFIFFKKGSQMASLNPLNFVGLGKIALLKGDVTGAKTQFDMALSKLPSKTNKDSDIPKEGQALTKAKIAEAWISCQKKDLPQAHILLKEAVILDPKNPAIFLILGDAFLEDNDGSNSIMNFKKAQELDPKSPLAKMKIGNIYVRGRNPNAAIPFFEEAVQIDSNFAPVYRELGELYYKVGKYEKAVSNYEKYLKLSPNTSAKVRFAIFKFLIKDYAGSLAIIDEVMKVDTTFTILYRISGYNYFETGKYNEALTSIKKYFSKAKPEKIRSNDYAYYGRTLVKLNQCSEGVEKLLMAYQLDSANCDVLSDIGDAYDRCLKQTDVAVKYYQMKSQSECAKDIDLYYTGKCYYKLLQFGKADTMLTSFITKQPNSMQGLILRARTRSGIDSTMATGLALPDYQSVIDKGRTDSVKYSKELIESYDYYASYNTLVAKDMKVAKSYWKLILLIDPKNIKADSMLKRPEFKNIP